MPTFPSGSAKSLCSKSPLQRGDGTRWVRGLVQAGRGHFHCCAPRSGSIKARGALGLERVVLTLIGEV
jgi:hypothetical protein